MFKEIGSFVKNSFVSILQGKFLLRLKVDKYIPQIIYVFFLMGVAIWVERNKKEIKDLDIVYTMKRFDLESRNDRRAISTTLEELGSEVKESDKPVFRITEE